MKENYADVLESYLIPAEEGFIGKTLTILGCSITALIALPFAIIGGTLFVSGVECAKEARKLRKHIKSNKGNYINYGSESYTILRSYSKDIIGVEEPSKLSKVLTEFQAVEKFSKELALLEDKFCEIVDNDPWDDESCKNILSKLKVLKSKVDKICNDKTKQKLLEESKNSEMIKNGLDQSFIMKLATIEKEVDNNLYSAGVTQWDNISGTSIVNECADEFVSTERLIMGFIDSIKYMELCKFAVDPKLKQSKK